MGLYRWLHPTDWPEYYVYCACDQSGSSGKSFIDWWSLSHFCWGLLASLLTLYMPVGYAFLLWVFISMLFEVYENSELGICIEMRIWCSPDYEGDHIANSIMDVIFNMLGFWFAYVFVHPLFGDLLG